jgi:hypothetical protein
MMSLETASTPRDYTTARLATAVSSPSCHASVELVRPLDRGIWDMRALRAVTLICTDPAGHEGDHYDETFGQSW